LGRVTIEENPMRKIRIFEHMSLDGVVQSSSENNFPYENWTTPYRSPAGLAVLVEKYGERYDLLLGRRTYDQWSAFWPKVPSNPMADRLNAATKYVVTHRPESLEWGPFKAVGPDVVNGIRGLKSTDGADLILCGSSTLTSLLLEHGLADEVNLLVYPVLLGIGKRFFAEGTPARSLTLDSTQVFPSGIVVNSYKPAGQLQH
jgi:dihydrofolate reductase